MVHAMVVGQVPGHGQEASSAAERACPARAHSAAAVLQGPRLVFLLRVVATVL